MFFHLYRVIQIDLLRSMTSLEEAVQTVAEPAREEVTLTEVLKSGLFQLVEKVCHGIRIVLQPTATNQCIMP
jgi:hypothetical protein